MQKLLMLLCILILYKAIEYQFLLLILVVCVGVVFSCADSEYIFVYSWNCKIGHLYTMGTT